MDQGLLGFALHAAVAKLLQNVAVFALLNAPAVCYGGGSATREAKQFKGARQHTVGHGSINTTARARVARIPTWPAANQGQAADTPADTGFEQREQRTAQAAYLTQCTLKVLRTVRCGVVSPSAHIVHPALHELVRRAVCPPVVFPKLNGCQLHT
jgi:hypothetical protein